MRLYNSEEKINYSNTRNFFDERAKKYNINNPYSVTMYQDNNSSLVNERNAYETNKLIPMMELNDNSRVLDLACGIGRWADAIGSNIAKYIGVDFSPSLIELAKKRNTNSKADYYVGTVSDVEEIAKKNGLFDRILIIGFLVYLNDEDVYDLFMKLSSVTSNDSIICIREPIGIKDKLTLKDFYSNELDSEYNAIYRTDSELKNLMKNSLLDRGFRITNEGFLFEDANLNNRKETSQYYYILKN